MSDPLPIEEAEKKNRSPREKIIVNLLRDYQDGSIGAMCALGWVTPSPLLALCVPHTTHSQFEFDFISFCRLSDRSIFPFLDNQIEFKRLFGF